MARCTSVIRGEARDEQVPAAYGAPTMVGTPRQHPFPQRRMAFAHQPPLSQQ
jgi:hypothetical protein